MIGKMKPEVLVVGAGPVGLMAALTLAKQDIPVVVVDREWRSSAHSYALALHPRSLMLLAEFGLLDEVLEAAYRVRRMGIYDAAAWRADVQIAAPGDAALPLAVLRQDVLEQVLVDALRRAGVTLLWNHAVSRLVPQADGAVATIDTLAKESMGYAVARTEWVVAQSRDLHVPFVIGADGHRSLVRRALDIAFPEIGPAQHFAVFEFATELNLRDEARLVLGPETTDVLWPLPHGHCRWSFQLTDQVAPASSRRKDRVPVDIGSAQFPQLDLERLRDLLNQRATWFDGRVEQIFWRILVRFERRLADAFGRDRIWLAGDAGHLTGPAGMQSMNVGLREAKQLAEMMAAVLRHGEPVTQLQDYGAQRLAEWRWLLGVERPWTADDQADPWISGRADRLISCLPASGAELVAAAKQLQLEPPGGPVP